MVYDKYTHLLSRSNSSRFWTQVITSTILFAISDWICQIFIEMIKIYDYRRTLIFASYGSLYAPIAHEWYSFLHRWQKQGSIKDWGEKQQVIIMTCYDQTLFVSFAYSWFYFHVGLLEEGNF